MDNKKEIKDKTKTYMLEGMAIGMFELDSECICFVALDAAVVSNPSQEMVDIVEMFKNRRRH